MGKFMNGIFFKMVISVVAIFTTNISLGQVFKCIDGDKTFYQSSPCLEGLVTDDINTESTNFYLPDQILLVNEMSLDKSLYPETHLPYEVEMELGSNIQLKTIGVLTDWWKKRPIEILVYDYSSGVKGKLLGSKRFSTYLDNVCGDTFNETCEYPDNQGSATAELKVKVSGKASAIKVQLVGLLSAANKFVILKGIRVYGR